MKFKTSLLTLGLGAALISHSALAHDLTIVNFGGANGEAQQVAFIDPLKKQLGIDIINVAYNGEQARVKAMVETNNVVWDVVEVETADIGRGCDEGYYEQLDWSKLPKDELIPEAVHACGVGTFVWSTVLAYNAKNLSQAPASWADFWNVDKFPGKRALRKGARYNMEFALMADGVPPAEVYDVLSTPEGVDRAFAKLDELKPHIQWWEAGAQPIQMLAAGDVSMSSAYNGRIEAANNDGQSLSIVWNESIYDLDYWVIPTGSPNMERAYEFIRYASSNAAQKAYAAEIAYGPINKQAIAELSPELLSNRPNAPENIKNALLSGYEFWVDHGEELDQRFSAWSAR
ncbi:MAG: ABC transporter substrate-binding protein [Alcaligenaceae bacterium]|nr:ABC transporter substrate-binding protein [Alcaligenaceae bacterium]